MLCSRCVSEDFSPLGTLLFNAKQAYQALLLIVASPIVFPRALPGLCAPAKTQPASNIGNFDGGPVMVCSTLARWVG